MSYPLIQIFSTRYTQFEEQSGKIIGDHYAGRIPLILRRLSLVFGNRYTEKFNNRRTRTVVIFCDILEELAKKRDFKSLSFLIHSYGELLSEGVVVHNEEILNTTFLKILPSLLPGLRFPPDVGEDDETASTILELIFPHLKNFGFETIPGNYEIKRHWPLFYYKLLTLQLHHFGSILPYENARRNVAYGLQLYIEKINQSEAPLQEEVEKQFVAITEYLEKNSEKFREEGQLPSSLKRKRSDENRTFQTTGLFSFMISLEGTSKTISIEEPPCPGKHYTLAGFLQYLDLLTQEIFFERLRKDEHKSVVAQNHAVIPDDFKTNLYLLKITGREVSIYFYTTEGMMTVQDYTWTGEKDSQTILNKLQEIKSQAEHIEKEVYATFLQFAQTVAAKEQAPLISIEPSNPKMGLVKDGIVFRTFDCHVLGGTKWIQYFSKEKNLEYDFTLRGCNFAVFKEKLLELESQREVYLQKMKSAGEQDIPFVRPLFVGSASTMLENLVKMPLANGALVYPFPNNFTSCFSYFGGILPHSDFEGSLENFKLLKEMEQCGLNKKRLHLPRLTKAVKVPRPKINPAHSKEALIDWALELIEVLQRHGLADANTATQTLFTNIKNGNLPEYNSQTHAVDYHIIKCKLSWIVSHLLSKKNIGGMAASAAEERLLQVAKEMHQLARFCGVQVFETVCIQYIVTFRSDEKALEVSSLDEVLNAAYRGAALDMIDTLKSLAQDPTARAQEIHLKRYLYKKIAEISLPLPVDPLTENAGTNQDIRAENYGSVDYPKQSIPDLIRLTLIPQFVKRMKEWQEQALRENRFNDVHLLVESLYDILEREFEPMLKTEAIVKLNKEIQETRQALEACSLLMAEKRLPQLEEIKARFAQLAAEKQSINTTLIAIEKQWTSYDPMELEGGASEAIHSAKKTREATKERLNFQLNEVDRKVMEEKMALRQFTEENGESVQQSVMASEQVETKKNEIAHFTETLKNVVRTIVSDQPACQQYFTTDPISQLQVLSVAGIVKLLVGNQFFS